jgi:spermidine synthase
MTKIRHSSALRWMDESGPYSNERHGFQIDEIISQEKTRYQDILIARNAFYGKMLFIDGSPQSAERDEFMYHEALVHPAMCLHPNPRHLLLLGGGPGAALREMLRYRSVARITMVDIDGEAVETCRRMLPEWSCGAFDDPRVDLVVGDGKAWLEKTAEGFDVIIMDLTDQVDLVPSFPLYTQAFFDTLKSHLRPGGIAVVQSGSFSGVETFCCASICKTLAAVFGHVRAYSHYIPSFFSEWSFVMASERQIKALRAPSSIDRCLASRLSDFGLRFYDGETHLRMMLQPKDVREALENTGIIVGTRQNFAIAYDNHYGSIFRLGSK